MIKSPPPAWLPYMREELGKDYYRDLRHYVNEQYVNHTCFPPEDQVFRAFELCSPNTLKSVLIGQDPYHGPGQANGLCFSVNPGIPHPPSLVNIFKEMEQDLGNAYPESGDLSHWAGQGVLMLNATLTVRASEAGSHQGKGWEIFTDQVIRNISAQFSDVVFMLWGGYAGKKEKLIDKSKHHILKSGHPSPLSANRGYWFGNRHFSKCNEILIQSGRQPIKWS